MFRGKNVLIVPGGLLLESPFSRRKSAGAKLIHWIISHLVKLLKQIRVASDSPDAIFELPRASIPWRIFFNAE